MPPLDLTARFPDATAFLAAYDAEIARGGLFVPGASAAGANALAPCRVSVAVAGWAPLEIDASIAAVVPGVGVAVMFGGVPDALAALAAQVRAGGAGSGTPAAGAGGGASASERIRGMTVQQKVALALTADREERFALLRDPNKTVHLFVLKNPRTGVDEVQYAAKNPSLSPDALKFIAEHREWGANQTVCIALVRNPRTPTSIALRVLETLPEREIRALAKGNARPEVVQAARRKVTA